MNKNFPDAHFGSADKPLPNWRDDDFDNEPDDDEEMEFTPDDVIAMLGFDPATDEDYEYSEPEEDLVLLNENERLKSKNTKD